MPATAALHWSAAGRASLCTRQSPQGTAPQRGRPRWRRPSPPCRTPRSPAVKKERRRAVRSEGRGGRVSLPPMHGSAVQGRSQPLRQQQGSGNQPPRVDKPTADRPRKQASTRARLWGHALKGVVGAPGHQHTLPCQHQPRRLPPLALQPLLALLDRLRLGGSRSRESRRRGREAVSKQEDERRSCSRQRMMDLWQQRPQHAEHSMHSVHSAVSPGRAPFPTRCG